MTVNPNFAPAKGMWDGTTLNIPGLMPVNIGSSNPYPVPFQTPRAMPQQQMAAAPQSFPNPASIQGTGNPPGSPPGGPGYQDTGGTIPSTQNTADAMFALMGMGGLGGSSGGGQGGGNGGGGGTPFGFAPSYEGGGNFYGSTPGGSPADPMAGWRSGDVTSMPLAPIGPSQQGQGYFDRLGSNISDKISSFGDTPDFTGGNVGQAAINAGGLFSPLIPALAGILQGFNLYDAPDTTGNPIADIAGKPGGLQTTVANVTNWIDRMFGGTRMPSSYIDPTAMGPNPDGSPYAYPVQVSNAGGGGGAGAGGVGFGGGGGQSWANNLVADTSAMSPQGFLNFGMGPLGTGDMGGQEPMPQIGGNGFWPS